jgi:hypothetical protein
MLGAYDFCGHYEWTFAWLAQRGGKALLSEYWDQAIHRDSQRHASALILEKGIEGMKEYWGHTLAEEGGGHKTTATEDVFRIDIHDCPSKGFLLRNHLEQHPDYCDHCMGWIGPMLKRAGFTIDHQHNHRGQCWWEMRKQADPSPPSAPGELATKCDVRFSENWKSADQPLDTFTRTNSVEEKAAGGSGAAEGA